jgi:hypothetical protein
MDTVLKTIVKFLIWHGSLQIANATAGPWLD